MTWPGEIFWIPLLIGAAVNGYMFNQAGHAKGMTGFKLAAFTLGGAALGALVGNSLGAIAEPMGSLASTGFTTVAGSHYQSLINKSITNGQSEYSLNIFGVANLSVSKNSLKLNKIGDKGNSGFENAMFAFGMVGVYADYMEDLQLPKNQATQQHLDELKETNDIEGIKNAVESYQREAKPFYGRWLGPNPDSDPNFMAKYGNIKPLPGIDEGAFVHDIYYFKHGGSGPMSAIFGRKMLPADMKLSFSGFINLIPRHGVDDFLWSAGVSILFPSISAIKSYSLYRVY